MCIHPSRGDAPPSEFTKKGALARTYLRKDRGPLWPRIKWAMLIYIGLVHVLGMVGLSMVMGGYASSMQLLWCFATYIMAGLGITAGAHRCVRVPDCPVSSSCVMRCGFVGFIVSLLTVLSSCLSVMVVVQALGPQVLRGITRHEGHPAGLQLHFEPGNDLPLVRTHLVPDALRSAAL